MGLFLPSSYNEFYDANNQYDPNSLLIFVFGSNLAGRHGKGAAKEALRYGARYGKGIGHVGNTYAIPTKDKDLVILSLDAIKTYIDVFIQYTNNSGRYFYVTQIGCGLAGYHPKDIAPLFKGAQYCWFSENWIPYIL